MQIKQSANKTNHAEYIHGYPSYFVHKLQNNIKNSNFNSSIIAIAIDNLPMIISGHGHKISEKIMSGIYEKIKDVISDTDIISRIQKDQFVILLEDSKEDELLYLTKRISSAVRHFSDDSEYISLHIICSVVAMPINDKDACELLDEAYVSLKKHQGMIPTSIYANEQTESANCRQEMGLANYLHKAIKENRLRLAYQPIVCAKTGKTSHYEALLRVIGENGLASSAGALIPIAERMGLIHLIDSLVLEIVIKKIKSDPNIKIAFNVSNLTTDDIKWVEKLAKYLDGDADAASRLIIEITETAVHRDLAKTSLFVAEIQALGVKVALDDFGSGYTSFRQLQVLSVDIVKIDGSFIKDLVDNEDNRFFVKTLLDFTKGFGLKSVAEYVENGSIAKMLMELGVDYMQGYYFGRAELNPI